MINKNEKEEVKESTTDFIKDRIVAREDISEIKVRKRMPAFGKIVLSLAFLGIVIIGIMIAYHFLIEPEPVPDPPTPVIITDEELEEIQELSTAKFTYTETQTFKDSRKFPWNVNIPFTEKSIDMVCEGKIKVYFNLADCTVNSTSGRVEVILPKTEVDHSLESVKVEENNNIFNPISLNDKLDMETDLKVIMESRAIENGMFDKSRESAKKAIQKLIEGNLQEGQVLDVHQSAAAIQEDEKYIKDTTSRAAGLEKKYEISNSN